jgi:DNA-binding MltR family transcriptional regulator
MTKKRLPATPEELDGSAAKFFETIKGESDRGCVLVAAAFLDESLEFLLRSKMTKEANIVKASIEPLFTGIGPLKSFWAKIELCRAFELLGDYQYSDLTRIRNLRNYFAHSYIDATFGDQKVVGIVSELIYFGLKLFNTDEKEKAKAGYVRGRFMLAAAWLAGSIHKDAGMAIGKPDTTND